MRRLGHTVLAVFGAMLASATFAHAPHDPIRSIAISSGLSGKHTVLAVSVGSRVWRPTDILASTNGGSTWSLSPKGLDNVAPLAACAMSPAFHTDRVAICVSFGDGVFRTTDGGATWVRSNSGLGNLQLFTASIALDGGGRPVMWVTTSAGEVYGSEDQGATWRAVGPGTPVTVLAPSPGYATDSTLFAGGLDGRISRSVSGGFGAPSDWADLPGISAGGVAVLSLLVPPGYGANGTILMGDANGLVRSTDFGASFTPLPGVPAEPVQTMAASPQFAVDQTLFAATAGQAVFKSVDGGDSWTFHEVGLEESEQAEVHNFVLAISAAFATDGTVYLGTFEGLAVSRDGGETWRELDLRPPTLLTDVAISPDIGVDQTLFASAYTGGAYLSRDLGETWAAATIGLGNFTIYDASFATVAGVAEPVLLGAMQDAVVTSSDLTGSWAISEMTPLPGGAVFPTRMVLSPDFGSDATAFMGTRENGLIGSTDGGLTWQQRLATPDASVSSVVVSPAFTADGIVLAATTDGQIHRSSDGGNTWSPTSAGLPAVAAPIYLAISPSFATDSVVFAGTGRGLYRSTDGGGAWNAVPDAVLGTGVVQALDVSPELATDGMLLATVRGRGLFRSGDGGTAWTEVAPALIAHAVQFAEIRFSPAFGADRTVFGVGHSALFRSRDAGTTWQDVSVTEVRHENSRQSVEFSDGWATVGGPQFSVYLADVSDQPGATASMRFHGRGVVWIGLRSRVSGIADVYIDGVFDESVDQYGDVFRTGQELYRRDDLAYGDHEIRVVVTDRKNALALSNATLVDALDAIRDRDTDIDTVVDGLDNCTLVANRGQRDVNEDGFGNACDADYDDNGMVGIPDFIRLRDSLFTQDPVVDLTDDGFVGIVDFLRFFRFVFRPPGPAGSPAP